MAKAFASKGDLTKKKPPSPSLSPDIAHAYDELSRIGTARIWTAERALDMRAQLQS